MKKKEKFQTTSTNVQTEPYKVKDWNSGNSQNGYILWGLFFLIFIALPVIGTMFSSSFKATSLLWLIPLLLIFIFVFIAGVNATSYRGARPCKELDKYNYNDKIWDKIPWETFKIDSKIRFIGPSGFSQYSNIVCCPNGYTYNKKNETCVKT